MLSRAFAAYHFAIYQTFLGLVAVVALLRILCDYSWPMALGYGSITVASYCVGQTIVGFIQRARNRRTGSSLD